MKCLIAHQPFAVCFLYVASHSDNIQEWSECTIKEQINIKVDKLAKKALIHAHLCSPYFDGNFPLEDFTIFTNWKVTGPAKLSLKEYWGSAEAKQFFDAKYIVHALDFDSIWWIGMGLVIESYPKMFHVFVTKQISGWCGFNSKISLWDTSISNVCPNCGMVKETSKHMTQCKHKGRVT
jgi:hypothetical protein